MKNSIKLAEKEFRFVLDEGNGITHENTLAKSSHSVFRYPEKNVKNITNERRHIQNKLKSYKSHYTQKETQPGI